MSLTRHDLPNGWADLIDNEDVTERARRPIMLLQTKLAQLPSMKDAAKTAATAGVQDQAALSALGDEQTEAIISDLGDVMPLMFDLNDLMVVARAKRWSYVYPEWEPNAGDPIPVTVDGLRDLPRSDYEALQALCASMEGLVADTDVSPDPKALTSNSPA